MIGQQLSQVLDILAGHIADAWSHSQQSFSLDLGTLRRLYFDEHSGDLKGSAASHWLSSSEVFRWWDARLEQLSQTYQRAALDHGPMLVLRAGGGRGNPTQYRLDIEPIPMAEASAPRESILLPMSGRVNYQIEPAKAAQWLRWIGGNRPFGCVVGAATCSSD
jgi:hypothetical protein